MEHWDRRSFLKALGILAAGCGGAGGSGVRTPADLDLSACGDGAALPEPVVDVHCHVFNGTDLPIAGFLAQMAVLSDEIKLIPKPEPLARFLQKKARLLHRLVNEEGYRGADELSKLRGDPSALDSIESVRRQARELAEAHFPEVQDSLPLIDLIAVVLGPRYTSMKAIASTYRRVNLFVPMLVDYRSWSDADEELGTPLKEQIEVHEELAALSTKGGFGDGAIFHSFAPFNPAREDSLDLLKEAVLERGFVGAKVYPPVGFRPLGNELYPDIHPSVPGKVLDQRLRAFYDFCQREDVPVTTHSANSNGYEPGFGLFCRPSQWEPVLEEFSALRLNLGHFGHTAGMYGDGIEACRSWMRGAARLMAKAKNLYVDMSNSAFAYDPEYAEEYLGSLETLVDRVRCSRERIMYGSDWWMNMLSGKHEEFVAGFATSLCELEDPALLQNVMGKNALRFLGLSEDSANRTRLRAWYDKKKLAAPAWLGA